jgi:acyl dehydratase
MREIRFDDIESLGREISEEFGAWGPEREITQAMIQGFADLTGDYQWIHVDVERARRESPFGGPIAHGFLTLSLVPGMRPPAGDFALAGYGSAINYGVEGLRFLSPVPSGSRVHARMRLAQVEQKPKGTLTQHEVAVHVVGSDKPSLLYRALVLYQPPRK